MSFKERFSTVPFELELIVDMDYKLMDSAAMKKLKAVVVPLKSLISDKYPDFEMEEGMTFSGCRGGSSHGPTLYGKTDPESFRNAFGKNIARGITVLLAPIPIPCDVYAKWYQTGNLVLPKPLRPYVKGIFLSYPAVGSFTEVDFFKPTGARRY